MTSGVEPQTPELRQEWDLDGALHPVWKALSLHQAADCLAQIANASSDLTPEQNAQRDAMLLMLKKFTESARDKQLLVAYKALGDYLRERGLLAG